ncbi:MAG TPA: response regulator [Candidatus Krumholzibacteria bacterium]|nr:response regulator [Candidatus Krumholzibacteria bacterium]
MIGSDTSNSPVLIVSSAASDATMAARVLAESGLTTAVCRDVHDLCARIDESTGAALVTEEALTPVAQRALSARLAVQPAWSDVPLILIMSRDRGAIEGYEVFEEVEGSTHVTMLRRPLHRATLVSAVRSALEARRRQMAIGEELRARRRREVELEESRAALAKLTETLEQRVRKRTALAEKRADGMRRLAVQLGDAERRERQRLAEVLHDGLQQLLLAAHMQIGQLRSKAPEELLERIEKIDSILRESMVGARTLSHELSPPVLSNADLGRNMEWLRGWFQEHHGLRVTLGLGQELPTVSETTRSFLLNSARELLMNAIKHSGSMEAGISVDSRRDTLIVEISDGGSEFDLQTVERALEERHGFGLAHIRDRIEALGGRMDVDTTSTGGGRFRFSIPIESREPTEADAPTASRQPGDTPVVRVQIADDHDVIREGIAVALDEQPGIEVVGEAANGRDAVAMVERGRPDVIVMDFQMPLVDGVEATREILDRWPDVRVIGLSVQDDPKVVEAMKKAGARRFVSKHAPMSDLIRVIREVAGEGVPASPSASAAESS